MEKPENRAKGMKGGTKKKLIEEIRGGNIDTYKTFIIRWKRTEDGTVVARFHSEGVGHRSLTLVMPVRYFKDLKEKTGNEIDKILNKIETGKITINGTLYLKEKWMCSHDLLLVIRDLKDADKDNRMIIEVGQYIKPLRSLIDDTKVFGDNDYTIWGEETEKYSRKVVVFRNGRWRFYVDIKKLK